MSQMRYLCHGRDSRNQDVSQDLNADLKYFVAAQAVEHDGKRYASIEIIDEETSRPCQEP